MSELEHSPAQGSTTPSAGQGDNTRTMLFPSSSNQDQMHAAEQPIRADPNAQKHPSGKSLTDTHTHLYPFHKSVNGENQYHGTQYAQWHPSGDFSTHSPTQMHPVSPSSTSQNLPSSQNEEQLEYYLPNDKTLSSYAKQSSKSPSKNKKTEMNLLKKLSSSNKTLKKSTARKKTSKEASSSKTSTETSNLPNEQSIIKQSPIPEESPKSLPNKQQLISQTPSVFKSSVVTRKEASTSTRTDSPVATDSPLHNQLSLPAQLSMPKLSTRHKESPTRSVGSSGSVPSSETHGRRTVNANTMPPEHKAVRTEGKIERLARVSQNGMTIESLMEQEIERLSLQKRDVVMRNQVIEPESWKREVQKQTEEELEQRVREALETPPLERMRRNRHKAKLKHAGQQQMSISLEECDSFAHTLPSLYNNHHRWDFSETSFTLSEQNNASRQNRFSRLAGRTTCGRLRDSNTEDDSDAESALESSNAYAASRRLRSLQHVDNHAGENGMSVTLKTESDSEGSDLEQARTVSEVRRKMFRQYTADGFKSAIRKGKSKLKKIGNGRYEDKNGIVLTVDGPFWPPECGPLYPKPEHQNFVPQDKELLADSVLDNGHTAHTQRTANQFRPFEPPSINVFDSDRTSKGTVPHIVPDGCSSSLVFESRFESGNLRQARRVGQFEYDLILKTDLYTPRHTQWFYFRVQRMNPGITYKFNIINLHKKDSLYNYGMRPLMYSEREAAQSSLGWHRTGHHINYGRSSSFQRNQLLRADMAYYTLSWQMEFTHKNDTCYFAHCYPYTFTDLRDHIDTLLTDPERRRCTKREVMCESRAGNSCFLITVTNFSEKQVSTKRGIVVTARVHPGETNASWMMKGLLDYITGADPVAKDLRKAFIFKIIPMLNPDGVIVGNYRCSLTGRDLNRNFRHPKKESFPTVWHAKEMLESFSKEVEVLVYCDLHGHSRKHNVFIYGCDKNGKEMNAASFLYQRLFPFLMSRKAPDKFSFRGCKFHVKRCKEATGRVVMWKELGISNSFTMEATFCGSKDIRREDTPRHFNFSDFEDLGRHFCEALLVYHEAQENKSLHSELILELTREITHQILQNRGLLPQQLLFPYMQNESSKHRDEASSCRSIINTTETLPDKSDATSDASKAPSSAQDKPGQLVCSVEGRLETMRMIDTLSSETFAGCIGILQDLHAMKDFAESDSSDSDSASEPDAPPPQEGDKQDEKKKKKKKGKNRSRSMPDGKLHLRLALKAHDQGLLPTTPSTNPHPIMKSSQINALHQDLNADSIGPNVHPFYTNHHGKSQICGAHDETGTPLWRTEDSYQTLYQAVEPRNIEMPLEAEHRISKPEQRRTRFYPCLLPSISTLYYDEELNLGDYGKPSTAVKTYPSFVNRYVGRSNAGIPMFSQERVVERATKRLESMSKLEQERLERQTTSLQLTDDNGDHAHLLPLPKHNKDEVGYRLDPSVHVSPFMVHCSIPGRTGNHAFQINVKQDYPRQNSAMIRGLPLALDMKGNTPPHTTPRRLEPVGGARIPDTSISTTYDFGNQTFSISQSHSSTVDHVTSDANDAGTLGHDLTNQRGNTGLEFGRPTNGVAGRSHGTQNRELGVNRARTLAQIDLRTFSKDGGENRLRPTRLPSSDSRGDHVRMKSATKSLSNPGLWTRNPGKHAVDNGMSCIQAPLPIRSPRPNRQTSAVRKNHVELIEQQYGRFLSGVVPKRAPSAAAKYLQSLAKTLKGSEALSERKEGIKKEL